MREGPNKELNNRGKKMWRTAEGFAPLYVNFKTLKKIHSRKLPFPPPGCEETRSGLRKNNDKYFKLAQHPLQFIKHFH